MDDGRECGIVNHKNFICEFLSNYQYYFRHSYCFFRPNEIYYNRVIIFGGDMMDYLTMKEAAERWGITSRMVTYYCTSGKIDGAIKKGDIWLIPSDSDKPIDGRTIAGRENKKKDGERVG